MTVQSPAILEAIYQCTKKILYSDEKIIADLNHSLENSRAVFLLEHPVYCVIPQIYQKFFNALYSVSQKLH